MANSFKLNEEDANSQKKRKKTSGGIIGLCIKSGIVKTEGQANALMLLVVLVGISAIVYINLRTFSS